MGSGEFNMQMAQMSQAGAGGHLSATHPYSPFLCGNTRQLSRFPADCGRSPHRRPEDELAVVLLVGAHVRDERLGARLRGGGGG